MNIVHPSQKGDYIVIIVSLLKIIVMVIVYKLREKIWGVSMGIQ